MCDVGGGASEGAFRGESPERGIMRAGNLGPVNIIPQKMSLTRTDKSWCKAHNLLEKRRFTYF
jgi:hypothetical protein